MYNKKHLVKTTAFIILCFSLLLANNKRKIPDNIKIIKSQTIGYEIIGGITNAKNSNDNVIILKKTSDKKIYPLQSKSPRNKLDKYIIKEIISPFMFSAIEKNSRQIVLITDTGFSIEKTN